MKNSDGFTLIEILSAMAILIIITLVVTQIFSNATTTWTLGEKDAELNAEVRAVMHFMSQELSKAIADKTISFVVEGDKGLSVYDMSSDTISFVAMINTPDLREVQEIRYEVKPMQDENSDDISNLFRLVRKNNSSDLQCYTSTNWWQDSFGGEDTLIENISSFELWCYPMGSLIASNDFKSYNQDNALPAFVDIFIEVLGHDSAIKAKALWDQASPDGVEFVDRNSKRYAMRVFFSNGKGYLK